MSDIQVGDSVLVQFDGDGAAGYVGKIRTVYKSGRLCVEFASGALRNVLTKNVVRVADDTLPRDANRRSEN